MTHHMMSFDWLLLAAGQAETQITHLSYTKRDHLRVAQDYYGKVNGSELSSATSEALARNVARATSCRTAAT